MTGSRAQLRKYFCFCDTSVLPRAAPRRMSMRCMERESGSVVRELDGSGVLAISLEKEFFKTRTGE